MPATLNNDRKLEIVVSQILSVKDIINGIENLQNRKREEAKKHPVEVSIVEEFALGAKLEMLKKIHERVNKAIVKAALDTKISPFFLGTKRLKDNDSKAIIKSFNEIFEILELASRHYQKSLQIEEEFLSLLCMPGGSKAIANTISILHDRFNYLCLLFDRFNKTYNPETDFTAYAPLPESQRIPLLNPVEEVAPAPPIKNNTKFKASSWCCGFFSSCCLNKENDDVAQQIDFKYDSFGRI